MTRKECLDAAAKCVLQDRASQYGNVERNFERIADLWEAYLHAPISPLDVAMMMSLLKIARAKANPGHADSFVDLAGYAACGAECASNCFQNGNSSPKAEGNYPENPDGSPEFKHGDRVRVFFCGNEAQNGIYLGEGPEGMKSWTCRVKTEDGKEGVCAKSIVKKLDGACSEPKFKRGDKVQFRVTLPSVSDCLWVDGTYARYDTGCAFSHAVYNDSGLEENVKEEDVRPAPKAEGCEDLVQRIKDVNPAIYGAGTEEA